MCEFEFCSTDMREIRRNAATNENHLHGSAIKIETAHPSSSLLVFVSSKTVRDPIHEDFLDSYFGNPKFTGVSQSGRIDVKSYQDKKDEFILIFSSIAG